MQQFHTIRMHWVYPFHQVDAGGLGGKSNEDVGGPGGADDKIGKNSGGAKFAHTS